MAVVVLFIFGGIWMMTQGRSPSVPPSASADPSISPVPFITSSLDALGAESSAAASVDVAAAADPKVVSAGGGGAAAAVELESKSKVVKAAVENKAEVEVAESPPPPRPRTFKPPAPPQSFTRWAALSIPTTCLRPGVSPSGIIPGLELHDREGVDVHYMRPEGTTEAVTSPEALQKTAGENSSSPHLRVMLTPHLRFSSPMRTSHSRSSPLTRTSHNSHASRLSHQKHPSHVRLTRVST